MWYCNDFTSTIIITESFNNSNLLLLFGFNVISCFLSFIIKKKRQGKVYRNGEAKLEAVPAKLLHNKGERKVEEESSDSEPGESTASL